MAQNVFLESFHLPLGGQEGSWQVDERPQRGTAGPVSASDPDGEEGDSSAKKAKRNGTRSGSSSFASSSLPTLRPSGCEVLVKCYEQFGLKLTANHDFTD